MSDTPTLDALTVYDPRKRIACQKGPSRMDLKEAKEKATARDWEACKHAVDLREKHRCRNCQRKTVKTLSLDKARAEHHHIVRRKKEPALLTDQRNVVLLCLECHSKVTRHKLHLIGKAADMFTLNGKSYLNADKPLEFV